VGVVVVLVVLVVLVVHRGPSGDDMPTATAALCRCFGYLHMALASSPSTPIASLSQPHPSDLSRAEHLVAFICCY